MGKIENLPANWEVKRLGECLEYEQPTKYIVKTTHYSNSYKTPVLTAGKSFILGYTNETEGIFSKIPVIIFDDFTTATKFVDFNFKVKSSAMKILHPTEIANIKFVYYFMQTIQHRSDTHKRYWIGEFSKLEIPLPPLGEQKEIVGILESRFARLDRARDLLECVKKDLKRLKQSVLKSAFNGSLLNPASFDLDSTNLDSKNLDSMGLDSTNLDSTNWEIKTLGEVCESISSNIALKDIKDKNGKYPIYGAKGIVSYVDFYKQEKECLAVLKDGAGVGRILLLPEKSSVIGTLHYLVNNDNVYLKYLYYFMKTINFTKYISGSAIPHIYFKDYKNEKIPLPPLKIQEKIVQRIEHYFKVIEQVEKLVGDNLANISKSKKSLLKSAFSGGLSQKRGVKKNA
ncbi:hypothetical protein CCY99_02425 [Helicobacter sp. 16-1353]|uniref:restriction endonuclease subunit S n=1 Tax=Helicobacter sp. 16-1353 TaxID=2004996 RepID=UPI000DCF3738|nr:restriction endonuclease subunit S [Helicobacter sp. 16-1353]RAX54638.1 hypothetical protein CCY99_02425 [Helicobacter sp. 16-1353]